LRETDRSITDICFDVGFTSRGTFTRTFSEIMGETPSQYRAANEPILAPSCFQMAAMRPLGAMRPQSSNFGDTRSRGAFLGSASSGSHR
jgi:AraC-like DNA-binding protein